MIFETILTMSLKGLTKAINRLPQQLKEKTGGNNEVTADSDYSLILNSFKVFATSIEKLHLSGAKYAKQLDIMLKELQNYCEHIEDILRGNLGGKQMNSQENIVTPVEVTSVKTGIESVTQQLRPHIDQLVLIVGKLEEVKKANNGIEKALIKRDHKRIDYDRYKADVGDMEKKKSNATGTFTVKDEKKLQELSTKYSQADYEYNTIHTEIKQQIPQLITLKPILVEPILYQMFQIQSILYASIAHALPQHLVGQTVDSLYLEISAADEKIKLLETISGPSKESLNRRKSDVKALEPAVSQGSLSREPPNKIRPTQGPVSNPFQSDTLPVYTLEQNTSSVQPIVPMAQQVSNPWSSQPAQQTQMPLIPPKPKSTILTATALYDFPGQETGDLPFKQGDLITIIEKTNTTEDWWKGKLGNKEGMFPANYVQMK